MTEKRPTPLMWGIGAIVLLAAWYFTFGVSGVNTRSSLEEVNARLDTMSMSFKTLGIIYESQSIYNSLIEKELDLVEEKIDTAAIIFHKPTMKAENN